MKTEELKTEAKRLKAAIHDVLGVPVSTAQSLELIAKTKNYPSWDAAAGCSGKESATQPIVLSHNEQIGQLIAFRAGLNSGLSLVRAVEILGEQPGVAATGWKRVRFDKDVIPSGLLAQTGLFDNSVIAIAKMGDHYPEWSKIVSDLVEYLHVPQSMVA